MKVWSAISDVSEMWNYVRCIEDWELIAEFPMILIDDSEKSYLKEGSGDTTELDWLN